MNTNRLPDETRVSRVHLRTADLDRELDFYRRVIGLNLIERAGLQATLSTTGKAPALLVFTEDRNATPRRSRTTGLYHVAIRFPNRSDLAHALRRLAAADYPIDGASDHGVSEALYLSDPDGNGVELYVDRPRSEWPFHNGKLAMMTEPLDFDSLLATAKGDVIPAEAPARTDIGHIHLHVADLSSADRFFREFLGFDLMQQLGNTAMFFSADGYHHHVAANIWAGQTPALSSAVGLISYRLEVPDATALRALRDRAASFGVEVLSAGDDLLIVRDPNGNELEVAVASSDECAKSVHLPQNKTELP